MKYFEKLSEYKTWDRNFSLHENVLGGGLTGATLSLIGANIQTNTIQKKLKAIAEIKKIKPNLLRASLIGGLFGTMAGAGRYFYEEEHYKK